MINFTVGPVQLSEMVRTIGAEEVPYFRTSEFSAVMLENECLMNKLVYAPDGARTVFITGSGTAAMEAAVMNVFGAEDKLLVINGGSFGNRFVELCRLHEISFTEICLTPGKALTREHLKLYENKGYTGFLVNVCETSTGVLYDMDLIGSFCKQNNIFLVADAISAFLADNLNMKQMGIDILLAGSQKALACPPGISIIVLSANAVERVQNHICRCMYFDLKSALKNGERGQTPYTPAVGILRQINARLKEIVNAGGTGSEQAKICAIACDFRKKIAGLPFEIFAESMSNAVTALHPINTSAYDIFIQLKDKYNIWVCPNGGELRDTIFRVGHIGDLTLEDNIILINALEDLLNRGLI